MQSVLKLTHADSPVHVYGSAAASESRISHLPLLGIEDHSTLLVRNEITPEYLPLAFNIIGYLLVLLLSHYAIEQLCSSAIRWTSRADRPPPCLYEDKMELLPRCPTYLSSKDCDRILVLDTGRIAESGSPLELLDVENDTFRQMVEQDPEREFLRRIILEENTV